MGGTFGNEGKKRRKRWNFPGQDEGAPIFESDNPAAGGTRKRGFRLHHE